MARGIASWFGGGKDPQMQLPAAPKYPTAEELFAAATQFGRREYPLAYGARESALGDIARGQEYYAGWQPTSFEEALKAKYFETAWPETERTISHGLSMTGMESLLGPQLGTARGKMEFDIGSYLSDLANQRAQYSLASRMGIDPQSMTLPYVGTATAQGNLQVGAEYENAMQRAMIDYQTQLAKAQKKAAMISSIGTLAGGAIGFGLGGPAGAGIGASLGGTAGTMFGGGPSPINLADAMSMYAMLKPTGTTKPVGMPTSTPYSTQAAQYGLNRAPANYYLGGGF